MAAPSLEETSSRPPNTLTNVATTAATLRSLQLAPSSIAETGGIRDTDVEEVSPLVIENDIPS
ncbi:hypothetical protein K443DRAFT_684867 [Laccaria amethystina LaAM-08-1]|uniref:Uncharacterized protein n=1 Tax=Laccaria amethystina LaAM-08-1 TaxID=1095629 RepID=A0A0C9WIH9_9AGAR|nr:hypothetical protein K443DRAFT_684867 [Laccaria amethystina LaAM-08-1]